MNDIADTLKILKGMQNAAQLRVMRSALNASMVPAVKALRAAAPKGTEPHRSYMGRTLPPGYLSRSIVKSTRLARDKSRVFGNVRLRSEAFYGSFIEHGWRPGKRNSKVKNASRQGSLSSSRLKQLGDKRVKVAGRPWFNPTVARQSEEAANAFFTKMQKRILAEFLK